MADGENQRRARLVGLAAAAALAVGLGMLTRHIAARPAYGERCEAHFAAGSTAWRACIQRLRFGGTERP